MFTNEEVANQVYLYKLNTLFRRKVGFTKLGMTLESPNIAINSKRWGSWESESRTISLCHELFTDFEWGAVEHVFLHEVAHMLATEVPTFSKYSEDKSSHGLNFQQACRFLDIPSNRCSSTWFLSNCKSSQESPVVEKVRKLMAKGNNHAVSESEASIFLKKAQELMTLHNISNIEVCGEEELYMTRPVTQPYKRFPSWVGSLGMMVSKYYNVKCIRTYVNTEDYTTEYYLELFGTRDNVAIAEYIFTCICNQGESLYKEFKKNRVKSSYRRCSMASFMMGLVQGYSSTLNRQKASIEEKIECQAVLCLKDKELNKQFNRYYGRTRTVQASSINGSGYSDGYKAGKNLKLNKGVTSNGNKKRMLSA